MNNQKQLCMELAQLPPKEISRLLAEVLPYGEIKARMDGSVILIHAYGLRRFQSTTDLMELGIPEEDPRSKVFTATMQNLVPEKIQNALRNHAAQVRTLCKNQGAKVIWALHKFSQWQPIIIHESIMDACTAQLMGVPSVSPCGTGTAWHLVDELEKRQHLGFLSQDDAPSKRAVKRWKEKLPQGRVIIGSYDGHKDLNEMATKAGWDAARKRLFALLEKAGFEYEYGENP